MSGIANGTVFGNRYIVQSQVGTGGMATVYKGVDSTLDRQVAIKVMLPQYASDPAFAQRFRQEARAAAALQNPYIVQVYDWGRDEATGTYYIVMEYLRGTDLKSGIRSHGALAPKKVAQIGAQVCSALAVAHAHDIIHRDIKPQNIMILPNGDAKVMDFGIARAKNSHLTQTNSVLGTAHYVSPEQAQGKELGPTSDLYSLGVVMYEAATGRLPFEGDDAVSVALKQVNEQPVPPRAINPNIDPTLEAIIMCLLRKDPSQRFQTADELRHALNSFIQGNPVNIPGFGGMTTRTLPVAGQTSVMRTNPNMTSLQQQTGPNRTVRMERASTTGERRAAVQREEERLRRAENTGASTRIGVVAAVVVLVVIVVVAVLAINSCTAGAPSGSNTPDNNATITTKTEQVPVPNLQNLTQAEAKNKLTSSGLSIGTVTTQPSTTVTKGKVISQAIASGTMVDSGTKVDIVVSSGTDAVTFDDIRGLSPDDANAKLTALGLKLSYDATLDDYSDQYAEGTIVTFSPANQSVAKGSTVTYGLSKGPQSITLVNYIGWNYSDVTADLDTKGISYTPQYSYDNDIAEGLVLWTDPGEGSQVKKGDVITIGVSQGKDPNSVTIDSYVGQEYTSVQSYLESLGLDVTLSKMDPDTADQAGTVAGTDPYSTTVTKGSKITLYYYGPYTPPTTSVALGDYSGNSLSYVQGILDSMGLNYTVDNSTPASSSDEVGQVISMSPSNTTVEAGSTVTLYVYGDVPYDDPTNGGNGSDSDAA